MGDTLSPIERSERMRRVRGKDTAPELLVRRMVHKMGFRFRLHRKELPGTPDLVFPRFHAVIFVHGCFWHRHTDPRCPLARMPKSRLDFWEPKLTGNCLRDLRAQAELNAIGWRILVVWECELGDKEQLQNRIRTFLEEPPCE